MSPSLDIPRERTSNEKDSQRHKSFWSCNKEVVQVDYKLQRQRPLSLSIEKQLTDAILI